MLVVLVPIGLISCVVLADDDMETGSESSVPIILPYAISFLTNPGAVPSISSDDVKGMIERKELIKHPFNWQNVSIDMMRPPLSRCGSSISCVPCDWLIRTCLCRLFDCCR